MLTLFRRQLAIERQGHVVAVRIGHRAGDLVAHGDASQTYIQGPSLGPNFNRLDVDDMKRGFLAGVLATLLVMCLVSTAGATSGKVQQEIEYRDIKVSLDGQVLDLRDAKGNTVEPFMFAGTNYIPARALAESLGLQVAWDGSTATVVLTHPEAAKPTYITRTGSKYHNDPHCNGGTYWEVPYGTATGMGLTPCDKCVH